MSIAPIIFMYISRNNTSAQGRIYICIIYVPDWRNDLPGDEYELDVLALIVLSLGKNVFLFN